MGRFHVWIGSLAILVSGLCAFGASHVEKIYDLPAGADCEAALITGTDGTMYGTTRGAGANSMGSIFSVTPDGIYTTLYSFGGPDGADPRTSLTCGTNGELYGTTGAGGASGLGTVFVLNGTHFQTLHSFAGSPDGATPGTALIWRDGYLYGATSSGGVSQNNGTIYKISPAGDYQIVYTFPLYAGVSNPWGNFTLVGSDLYLCEKWGVGNDEGGVVMIGGTDQYQTVKGYVPGDGIENPNGSLLYLNGTFFGTSNGYRETTPVGSVFDFPLTDTLLYSVLRLDSWNGVLPDSSGDLPHYAYDAPEGTMPVAGLIQATNGDLLGSNSMGGANGVGTLFKVDMSLTAPFLSENFYFGDYFSFGGTYGDTPLAALVQGTDGNYYGATSAGGANGGGTIYRVLQNQRPNAPDYQFTRVSGQPLVVDLLAGASDPDGDSLTFVGLFPLQFLTGLYPVISSSDGVVTIPQYGNIDQFVYVVSDGMDVAMGSIVVTNTSASYPTGTYTGALMHSGTSAGAMQITVATTGMTVKGVVEQSTSLTGVVDCNGVRNSFVATSGKSEAGNLDGITLTASPAHGWNLTLTNEYGLQWQAELTGPGEKYSATLEPLTASGIVHRYYTVSLAESGTTATGFAFMVLDNTDTLRLTGKLPDGTPFTGSAGVGDGQGAIAGTIGTSTQIAGTLEINSLAGATVTGTVGWQIGSASYQALLTATPYTAPAGTQSALNVSHGKGVNVAFARPAAKSFARKAVLNAPNKSTASPGIEFSINPQTGMISGLVLTPTGTRWLLFQGAVIQPASSAAGCLQDGQATGAFSLTMKP